MLKSIFILLFANKSIFLPLLAYSFLSKYDRETLLIVQGSCFTPLFNLPSYAILTADFQVW